jgi:ribose 5-phosphate isomerase A
MGDLQEVKRALGTAAVDRFVHDGMQVGLGTGTTAIWATRRVGELLAGGRLHGIRAVTTSLQTELEARGLGIPVVTLNDAGLEEGLDLTIDGADEVDADRHLIKGGGGAMLLEKSVAYASRRFLVIVDDSKLSSRLGERFPVPVEVVPGAVRPILAALRARGAEAELRMGYRKAGPVVTDLGNLLIDARFPGPFDAAAMEAELKLIPGVLDTGLFTGKRPELLVGHPDGTLEYRA